MGEKRGAHGAGGERVRGWNTLPLAITMSVPPATAISAASIWSPCRRATLPADIAGHRFNLRRDVADFVEPVRCRRGAWRARRSGPHRRAARDSGAHHRGDAARAVVVAVANLLVATVSFSFTTGTAPRLVASSPCCAH